LHLLLSFSPRVVASTRQIGDHLAGFPTKERHFHGMQIICILARDPVLDVS
jgi:hypothetical protein